NPLKGVVVSEPKPDAGVARFIDFLNVTEELGLEYLKTDYGRDLFNEAWDPDNDSFASESLLDYVGEQICGIHDTLGSDVARQVYDTFMAAGEERISAGAYFNHTRKLFSLTKCFTPEERWDIHVDEIIRDEGELPANFGENFSGLLTDIVKQLDPETQRHAIREACNQYPLIFTEPYTTDTIELDGVLQEFTEDHTSKGFLCRNILGELPYEFAEAVDYVNQDPNGPDFLGLAFSVMDVAKLEGAIATTATNGGDIEKAIAQYQKARTEFAKTAADAICEAYANNPEYTPKDYIKIFFANVRSVAGSMYNTQNSARDSNIAAGSLVNSQCGPE
ncbi:hypothetical protein HOB85_04915, partial [Candidatus Woesearchaeota archaeon]|nr:hypothetical protein [Candidatus Woesearchaeota archaeon]